MDIKLDTPRYQAKILRNGKELFFDFSHLEDLTESEDREVLAKFRDHHSIYQMVADWCNDQVDIAKHCSSFVVRLPGGKIQCLSPKIQ